MSVEHKRGLIDHLRMANYNYKEKRLNECANMNELTDTVKCIDIIKSEYTSGVAYVNELARSSIWLDLIPSLIPI